VHDAILVVPPTAKRIDPLGISAHTTAQAAKLLTHLIAILFSGQHLVGVRELGLACGSKQR